VHNANNTTTEHHATQEKQLVEPVPLPQEEAWGQEGEGPEEKEDP
jgi:hypothetical protein